MSNQKKTDVAVSDDELDTYNRKGVIKEPEEQLSHYGSQEPFRVPEPPEGSGPERAREAPRVPTDSLTED